MRLSIFLVAVGLLLAVYGYTLPVYTDEKAYLLEVANIGTVDAAKHFYSIQSKYLTTKYACLDYAGCFIIGGILTFIMANLGTAKLGSPRTKSILILIGLTALVTSVLAFYVAESVIVYRNLFPPWAEHSMPEFVTLKKTVIFFSTWFMVHILAILKDFKTAQKFSTLSLDFVVIGLLSSTIVAGAFLTIVFIGGEPIYVLPAFLWFYVHLSILVGKQSARRMET